MAALQSATAAELKEQWRALFGKEPPPFNRPYLVSRLSYRVQARHAVGRYPPPYRSCRESGHAAARPWLRHGEKVTLHGKGFKMRRKRSVVLGSTSPFQVRSAVAGAVRSLKFGARAHQKPMENQGPEPCRLNRPSPKVRREWGGERGPEGRRCGFEVSTLPPEPRPNLRLSAADTMAESVRGGGDWSRKGNR